MLREIRGELSPGDAASAQLVRAHARVCASDDVVVSQADSTFALTHVTWAGKSEVPPWPTSVRLGHAVNDSRASRAWEQPLT